MQKALALLFDIASTKPSADAKDAKRRVINGSKTPIAYWILNVLHAFIGQLFASLANKLLLGHVWGGVHCFSG